MEDKFNPDTTSVSGQANETHRGYDQPSKVARTVFGAHVSDSDELSRPPEDRSPLTFLFNRKH